MSNKIEQEFQQKKEPVRLNKYLSEAGVCSRREADRLIESGRVSVDGKRAETGMRILPLSLYTEASMPSVSPLASATTGFIHIRCGSTSSIH